LAVNDESVQERRGLCDRHLKQGKVDLDDPATTVALLKLNAVVGVKGFVMDERSQEETRRS